VPLEFLPRALGPIYDVPIELRRPQRLLLVGVVDAPPAAQAQEATAAPPASASPPAPPPEPGGPPASPPAPLPGTRAGPRLRTMVIDAGHGGDDQGVRGPNGGVETQIALEVARRLRTLVETRLGVRVVMTRDDDRAVAPDARDAAANNSKADLFLSLHANGALGPGLSGAEVYFLSLDREGETVRRTATADAVSLPVLGGGRRLVEVVPWNLAQAAYIDKSAKLAGMLEEELRRRVPMSPRAVQRAGMRVLTGANMPAALVEMAYLTNPDQAVNARGDEFRNAVADAVYEAVARFRAAAIEKPTP